jgi:hypothetical protein
MTDMKLKFSATGFAQARRDFQDMRERTQDLRPAWDALLSWWADRNATHFRNRGRRWRTPWKQLAPSTLSEKLRLGYPPDPLVRTGELRHSLTVRPLGIERLRPHELEAGTATRYAHFHQSGTRRMPRRQLINARAVQAEGKSSTAVINWIVHGKRSTRNSSEDQ